MDDDKKRKRDNELFLKAFEKPTQIYRYMRWRSKHSPIYLNRNLSYLRGFASRGKPLRHENVKFDFSDFVERMKALKDDKINENQLDVLVFKIYGCFDEKIVGVQPASIDIYSISKHTKSNHRDKLLCSNTVVINPSTLKSDSVEVTVPKEQLDILGRKSSQLLLEVSYNVTQNDEYSRSKKRKKVSYGAHLNVFDKNGRCILVEAEYELLLRNNESQMKKYRFNYSHWQDIPISFSAFTKGAPRLKFFLCWGNQDQLNSNQFTTASQLPLNMYANKNGIKSSTSSIHSSASSSTSGISSDMTEDVDLSSAIQKPNQITNQVEMENISSHLVYRFLYGDNLSQRTEACDNFNCPWCYLNCYCLKALMMHLKLCHDRFKFSVTKNEKENNVLIDVRINEQYKCSISSKVKKNRRIFNGLTRRETKTKVLVARRRSNIDEFNSFDLQSCADTDSEPETHEPLMFDGHVRGYYRSTNNLPYTHRLDFDEDSEGEHDSGWLRKQTNILINDFSDVNEGEKELMVMWNWHVMKKNFVGMSQMPLACEMFIDTHGEEIWARNLYRNFTLHLCNLFDNGMLSSANVANITQRLQSKRKMN